MVVDNQRLVGIFTERDALFRVLAEGRNAKLTLIADVMTSNPLTIGPRSRWHTRYTNQGGFRHVPVVENGRPIGMDPPATPCLLSADLRIRVAFPRGDCRVVGLDTAERRSRVRRPNRLPAKHVVEDVVHQ